MGARKLATTVFVTDDEGQVTRLLAGETPPAALLGKIGEHCYEPADDDDDDQPHAASVGEPPKKSATKGEWVAYATKAGIAVDPKASKDEIVAAVLGLADEQLERPTADASLEDWLAYAEQEGIEVPEDADVEAVIDAVTEAESS